MEFRELTDEMHCKKNIFYDLSLTFSGLLFFFAIESICSKKKKYESIHKIPFCKFFVLNLIFLNLFYQNHF